MKSKKNGKLSHKFWIVVDLYIYMMFIFGGQLAEVNRWAFPVICFGFKSCFSHSIKWRENVICPLTWNKTIWGWLPLLTMIPVRADSPATTSPSAKEIKFPAASEGKWSKKRCLTTSKKLGMLHPINRLVIGGSSTGNHGFYMFLPWNFAGCPANCPKNQPNDPNIWMKLGIYLPSFTNTNRDLMLIWRYLINQ